MADTKLSDLTAVTTAASSDLLYVVASSNSRQITVSNLLALADDYNSALVTLTGTQTLTNKTITSPSIGGTVSGGAIYTSPVLTTPQINDTSADHQYVFAVNELSADRTVTLPLLTGNDEFVFKDFTQTLTNKTLTTPTIADFTNATHDHGDADDGGAVVSASTTVSGVVEIAIASEVNTGTDATRAVSPDALAGSNLGIRYVEVPVFGPTTDVATGDGKAYFHIPPGLNGMNLVYAHGFVVTAGTTNSTTIQINNLTQAADMLTALIEIETGETGSDTAAPGVTIDTNNDDVATNDVIRIDVDTISTTAPKGLVISLGFQLP